MKKPSLLIPTEQPSLELREFATKADDKALFKLTKENEEFWLPFASDVVASHEHLSDVRDARIYASEEGELRLGIYLQDTLIGWVSAIDYQAYPEVGYWCGIWLDQLNIGKGRGTAAVRSLARHIRNQNSETWLSTSIHQQNHPSQALFERVGFSTGHNPLPYQDDDHDAYKLPPQDSIR